MASDTKGALPKAPADTRDTMKAIVRYKYGSPDVLELRGDIDKPEIADDEMLVRGRAAGVDRGVWYIMTGLVYPIRLAGYGLRAPKNPVLGMDLAGVVEAVASNTVQIAKASGDHVAGVCSTAKAQMVRAIGADSVIDNTREDFAEGEHRYDLIVDIGGNSSLASLRRALMPEGTLVIVGGEGRRWLGGTDRQLRAMVLSPFVSQKLLTFINEETYEYLLVLKDFIESGKVTPVIDSTYPLAEVSKAIRYLEEGDAQGKVVIAV